MSKPAEVRIIPCAACGGDGGHHGFDDVWERCNLCSGEGELEYDVEPVGLDDLQKANEEAAVSNVELLIENLVQAAAEYENNCDRLVAKTIRVELEKAKQAIRDALIPTPAQGVVTSPREAFLQSALEEILKEVGTSTKTHMIARTALAAQPPAAPVEREPIVCDKCNEVMAAAALPIFNAADFNVSPQRSAATSEAGDPIRWIKDTYLMWLKGDLDPAHMRLGQHFFRAQPQVAPTQPFYGARCAAYPNCSGGCGCGCTHEIGDVEARIAVLSDALKRISKNTCCDNCQEAARVARSALGAYVGLARQPEPLSRSSADRAAALRLLIAEDERQSKLHDLLETIREQIRTGVEPEHRPEGLFKNIQDAVYAMRGRTRLMDDAAITHIFDEPQEAWQPIETAKRKDGTRIQAWDGKKQFICHFRGEHHEPHQDKPGWFEQHIRMHPTHWKPLGPSPLSRPHGGGE